MAALLDRLSARAARFWPPGGGEVAIAHRFQRPPYGGSNQFLLALRGELRRRGYRVAPNRVTRRTSACLLNAFLFDERLLARADLDRVRVVHRVDGPVGVYRGFDDGADRRVAELNERYADATIFQSHYSLDATRELGIELCNPTVIHNAVDPAIFRPGPSRPRSGRIRVIATSWSDNENKGFDVYAWLDRNLDRERFELTFVGRSPVVFEHARVVGALPSHELADVLRNHDLYLTASRNDPCSNALLEALACGLPAVYLRSGGHPELVGGGGVGFTSLDDLPYALDEAAAGLEELRRRIAVPPLAEVADRYLETMGLSLRPDDG